MEQLESHIIGRASWYTWKCANISPYMRRTLVIYEFPYIWGKFGYLFYQCTYEYLGWNNRCCVVGSTRVYGRDRDVWVQGNICSPPRIINKHLLLFELATFCYKSNNSLGLCLKRIHFTIMEQLTICDLRENFLYGLKIVMHWKKQNVVEITLILTIYCIRKIIKESEN